MKALSHPISALILAALLAGSPSPGRAQVQIAGDFQPVIAPVPVEDLDGRLIKNWEKVVALRLHDNWLETMRGDGTHIPDPLRPGEEPAYPSEDLNFEHAKFGTDEDGVARLRVVQPTVSHIPSVDYEYRFIDAENQNYTPNGNVFSVFNDGTTSLHMLRAPWHTHLSQREWMMWLVILAAWVAFATLIYRGIYEVLLKQNDSAYKSRDLAVGLWLFLATAAYGTLLWFVFPRSPSMLIVLGVLSALFLTHVVVSLMRPREEGL